MNNTYDLLLRKDKDGNILPQEEVNIMICNNCIHDDLCEKRSYALDSQLGDCCQFKDKSKVFEAPCQIGECIYSIHRGKILEHLITGFSITNIGTYVLYQDVNGLCYSKFSDNIEMIGDRLFLTKKEVEQKMKEVE